MFDQANTSLILNCSQPASFGPTSLVICLLNELLFNALKYCVNKKAIEPHQIFLNSSTNLLSIIIIIMQALCLGKGALQYNLPNE